MTVDSSFSKLWILVSLCGAALVSCLRDGGFVSPDEEKNLPVLASFQGRAITKKTPLDGERALEITNPKIALVWQFVGPSSFGVAFDKFSVGSNPPYKFSAELKNSPPPEIADSDEPVIGTFWLYSDGNGNDTLDRLVHPKVAEHDADLAKLQKAYKRGLERLREVSDELSQRIPSKDTFLVDSTGTFIRLTGGRLDTLFVSSGPRDVNMWNEVLFRRYRLLRNFNGWQNFFALRKKTDDSYRTIIPMADHSYLQIFEDWRKLLPKKGMEEEFEKRLKEAGFAYLTFIGTVQAVQKEAADSGWADYPYEGFSIPGADWVVGKSRRHFVLYFPTGYSLEQVLEAERGGSFRVDNIDKLHLGYNLLDCDDQYRCLVMSPKDSVYLELGQHEAFFNPPSSELKFPVQDFSPRTVPVETLKTLSGYFLYRPNRPITLDVRDGEAWCHVPDLGAHRLEPADSNRFFAQGADMQLEFVRTRGGAIGKLLLYSHGERAVAVRIDSIATPDLAQALARIRALKPVSLPESLRTALPGKFSYGKDTVGKDDTLRAHYSTGGDSIVLSYSGLPPQAFLPLNDSEAFSPASEDRLAFARNEAGVVTGMRFIRPTGSFFLPNTGYRPRKPVDFFSDTGAAPTLSQPASVSGGSGKDSYVKLGAQKRYACSQDGFFLKAGDGWVDALRKGATGDSISLQDSGDGLVFKVTGQAGKRIRLELVVCGEKGGKQGRILMAMRGGSSAQGPYGDPVAESDWVRPSVAGDTLSFSPIRIPADPYYLDLRQVHTYDDSLFYSFDGYRAWSD
ncbi:MAG TPA: hypothetical protein VJ385_21455 [Fibrobacteria bacterium]|nr:hypothetical protein [Fibrobacteria bacterium]